MLVLDVVVHTSESLTDDPESPNYVGFTPRGRIDFSDDLWVGKLDEGIVEAVFDRCEPPGWMTKKAPRLFGQLYAFVREPAPAEPPNEYAWDSDERLQTLVALSRLVHPTSISFRYAARVFLGSGGTIRGVLPGPVTGHGSDAWIAKENHRDYLTDGDLLVLRQVTISLQIDLLPPRVWRALWYHEYAARTLDIGVRWTFVSTALEALVHTDRERSTRQFTQRVPQLARELGGCEFSEVDAKAAYHWRSSLSHGQGLAALSKETQDTYERMETVLRRALKRCIQEGEIAAIFSDDQTIRDRWPL
jgi:hypothetical protein